MTAFHDQPHVHKTTCLAELSPSDPENKHISHSLVDVSQQQITKSYTKFNAPYTMDHSISYQLQKCQNKATRNLFHIRLLILHFPSSVISKSRCRGVTLVTKRSNFTHSLQATFSKLLPHCVLSLLPPVR